MRLRRARSLPPLVIAIVFIIRTPQCNNALWLEVFRCIEVMTVVCCVMSFFKLGNGHECSMGDCSISIIGEQNRGCFRLSHLKCRPKCLAHWPPSLRVAAIRDEEMSLCLR